jgi:hypothetical protein
MIIRPNSLYFRRMEMVIKCYAIILVLSFHGASISYGDREKSSKTGTTKSLFPFTSFYSVSVSHQGITITRIANFPKNNLSSLSKADGLACYPAVHHHFVITKIKKWKNLH